METYRIVSDGNMLMVDPWIHALAKECVFYRVEYDPFTSEKKRFKENLYYVQRVGDRNVGYVADGLCDRLLAWFSNRGLGYTFDNKRYWKELPIPSWDKVDFEKVGAREGQEDALATIATNYNGVIDAATGYGKTFLIVQICKMYPNLNIVITTGRKSVVKTIYERLHDEISLRSHLGVVSSWKNTGPDHRIVVTTTKSLHKTNQDKCDLLLFDECHGLAAPGTAYKLAGFRRARKFGFSASPVGRGDKADLVLEGLIGPVRFTLPYQDAVKSGSVVPITVHMYDVASGPNLFGKRRLSMKRHGIWQNKTRNQRIADVAVTFGERQVLIMCETIEHVMHLKKLLPGYTAAYANCSKERYNEYVENGFTTDELLTDDDLDSIQDRFESGELKHLISTFIFREGVDFCNLYALVRADGQAGPIAATQIPGRLSRKAEGKDSAVLVDFYDSFNPIMEGCSKSRIKVYNDKGWKIEYKDRL
jgi:superfamily II DNA or RNA helicase